MSQLLVGHLTVTLCEEAEMIFFYMVDLDHHACLFLKPAEELSREDAVSVSSAADLRFQSPQTAALLQPYLHTQLSLIDVEKQTVPTVPHFFEDFLQRFLKNRYFACSVDGLKQVLSSARHYYNQQYDCQ